MAIKKAVYVDTGVYRNLEVPEKVLKESQRKAKEVFANVGINSDEFAIEQKVIIRNTLIRRKKNGNKD